MQLRVYVFLFRNDGSLKHVPNGYWQQALDGLRPFSGLTFTRQKFVEVNILAHHGKSQQIASIRSCNIGLDTKGFITDKVWEQLPKPELSDSIHQLFRTNERSAEPLMVDYLAAMFNCGRSIASPTSGREAQLECYIDEICAIA